VNILFICEIDFIRKVVFDVHLLAEAMSLRGHNIYVIDYESMWQRNGDRLPREQVISRVFPEASIHLVHPRFIKIKGLNRMSAFISHYFEIKRIIKMAKIEAVVLYSVPTNGLQTVHWAREFGIPIIFRSLDVLNQLVTMKILRSMTRYLEGKVYSSVDKVLTITPKLSEYAIGLGADSSKVDVLPIPVDTNTFHPNDEVQELRQRWGIAESDKVLLFMGTLFNFSGLGDFLFQFTHILRGLLEVKLLIVGDGEQRPHLEEIIKILELQEQVIITGFQPYQDMPLYINLADVCINPFISNEITKDIFPGKTVQYLACGKPLVMRPLDGVKAVISGEEQGVVYCDTDNRMVFEVLSLLQDDERRHKIGNNGLEYARKYHGAEQVAKQLEDEIVSLK